MSTKPRCLETRRSGHFTMRRYKKPNGRRVKTMEIPWTMWLRVKSTVVKQMPGFEATEAARDRIAVIEAHLRRNEKPEWIAAVCGVTPARVRQIKARMET